MPQRWGHPGRGHAKAPPQHRATLILPTPSLAQNEEVGGENKKRSVAICSQIHKVPRDGHEPSVTGAPCALCAGGTQGHHGECTGSLVRLLSHRPPLAPWGCHPLLLPPRGWVSPVLSCAHRGPLLLSGRRQEPPQCPHWRGDGAAWGWGQGAELGLRQRWGAARDGCWVQGWCPREH